jgi:hypothetical protein
VADTLAKRCMLLKDASGKLSRSETIQGKSRRVYVVTSDIFSAPDYQKTGVVGVKGVAPHPSDAKTPVKITTYRGQIEGHSDHTSRLEGVVPVWPEKSSNFSCDSRGTTPVTPATPENDMAGEKRPKCAQCNGAPDGKEVAYTINGAAIWLHPQCKRFWSQQ